MFCNSKSEKRKLLDYLKKAEKLQEIRTYYPLAVASLWLPHCHRWDGKSNKSDRLRGCGEQMQHIQNNLFHCPKCDITEERTSQRQAMLSLGSESTLISGGNRSGKTEAGCMLAVAFANGTREWWVRSWLDLNDLPHNLVPENPSEVWVSALSYGDALTYLRPKIKKYCPVNTKFVRWKAQDRASIQFENGGKILSLSADSGREKYQGGAVSLVLLDEEHSQDIFDECMLRCIDYKGKVVLTMTPLKGITWPYDVFFENVQYGYTQYAISGLDNPWISSVKLRRAIAHMSEESKRSRLFGDFTNQSGIVYPELQRKIHVVESFDPPKEWPRDRSIDFGVRNPFACLFFAHDEKDDVLHVYGEYYATERTTIENGRRLKIKDPNTEFRWTVADPESRDGRLTLARECGIETKIAPKHLGVIETINYVKERLSLDVEGKPHLIIHNNCKQLLKEFRLYRWSDGTGRDKPIKKFDHGLDALRYQITFLKRYMQFQK